MKSRVTGWLAALNACLTAWMNPGLPMKSRHAPGYRAGRYRTMPLSRDQLFWLLARQRITWTGKGKRY